MYNNHMQAGQITTLLKQIKTNDKAQLDEIYGLLYNDIKAIAYNQLAMMHNNQTISATVLAHECYLKLMQTEKPAHQDRRHLLNYLAKAMRRFLIDQIKSKNRLKRKGLMNHDQMSQILGDQDVAFDLLEVDRMIDILAEVDTHLADLFQQKIIFNFTFRELGELFDLSERQIIRQWNHAKTLILTLLENNHGSE
jgi:RNA polymerase sigma factor (TIGR02999 family)